MGFVTDLFGAGDAKDAADEMEAGYRQGEQTIRQAGDEAHGYYTPYQNTSHNANRLIDASMRGDYSGFYTSPDYQFRLSGGNKAMDRSGSANGMSMSGAQMKSLSDYNQGMASTEYNNWYNKMAGLRGEGIGIADRRAGISMDTGYGVAGMQTGQAGARASGYMADANIKNSLTSNLLGSAADAGTYYATGGTMKPGG